MNRWGSIVLMSSLLLLGSCTATVPASTSVPASADDERAVRRISQQYVSAWLAGDAVAVLGLFTDDATIVPSGMAPKRGRAEIESFWFPDDGSETTIHRYQVEILDLRVSEDLAYTVEKGSLSFSYRNRETSFSKETSGHAMTVYQRQRDGRWKILSRMWTNLP